MSLIILLSFWRFFVSLIFASKARYDRWQHWVSCRLWHLQCAYTWQCPFLAHMLINCFIPFSGWCKISVQHLLWCISKPTDAFRAVRTKAVLSSTGKSCTASLSQLGHALLESDLQCCFPFTCF